MWRGRTLIMIMGWLGSLTPSGFTLWRCRGLAAHGHCRPPPPRPTPPPALVACRPELHWPYGYVYFWYVERAFAHPAARPALPSCLLACALLLKPLLHHYRYLL